MIDAEDVFPITRQAELLELSRASVYYLPTTCRGRRHRPIWI